MSTPSAFADEAASTFAELTDRYEAILPGGISAEEMPEAEAIDQGLRGLQPAIEEGATTLRFISQTARAGVTRVPFAPMRREIADLMAYKASRAGVKNITSIWARKRRVSAGTSDAA